MLITPDCIRFFLPIFSDESLLIRLLVRCFDMLFPVRTPLHNLFTFVHPKVVSVFSKLSSQRINWYNYFCYHIASFLFRCFIATISRPSRTSRSLVRSLSQFRCKDTSNILLFPNFFAKIILKKYNFPQTFFTSSHFHAA